jgi:ribosomal protein S18 acetylase RimI-like enzyme
MIGQWLPGRRATPATPEIRPLTVADVGRLDLGWTSLYAQDELREHLWRNPTRSFWIPTTREYLIGGQWRHRHEIGSLVELGSRGEHRAGLVQALLDVCRAEGCPLVVFNDTSEIRPPRWYGEIGFELVQEIIVYELNGPRVLDPRPAPRLRFVRAGLSRLGDLIGVDHRAFPYLWWNSEAEFENYLDQTGVRVFIGHDADDRPVAYAGVTLYQNWGHLDRLAVIPELQGKGYGVETLHHAMEQVAASGARRIGLSTQADNHRSQVLYERAGFRRTYRTDYRIYGAWLTEETAVRREVLHAPAP